MSTAVPVIASATGSITEGGLEGSLSPQITETGTVIRGSTSFRSGRPAAMRSRHAMPSAGCSLIQRENCWQYSSDCFTVESFSDATANPITGSWVPVASHSCAIATRLSRICAESASAFVSQSASAATASGCRRWMSRIR